MKSALIVLTVLFALATIGMWVGWALGNWFIGRDTTNVLNRAQVAANAADMHEYMVQLQKNMEQGGMTHGSAAVIFKTPENDMGLIYKTVVRVNQRLEVIRKLSLPHLCHYFWNNGLRRRLIALKKSKNSLDYSRLSFYYFFVCL
jgi:hypothetical protein